MRTYDLANFHISYHPGASEKRCFELQSKEETFILRPTPHREHPTLAQASLLRFETKSMTARSRPPLRVRAAVPSG